MLYYRSFILSPFSIFLLCTAAGLLVGCGASELKRDQSRSTRSQVELVRADEANPPVGRLPAAAEKNGKEVLRKVISTARIDLITSDFETARSQLEGLLSHQKLTALGGFVTQSDIAGASGSYRHSLWTVRVPQDKMESFIEEVMAVAELVQSVSGAQDVTDQYVDLAARLTNKQREEARLLSHLEKSGALTDTLLLEKELSRVREEVERLQGQLNVLTSASDLATVSINLQERDRYIPPTKTEPTNFFSAISTTFVGSYWRMITFLQGLAIGLAAIIPWMLPATAIGLPMTWGVRRYVYRNLKTL